MDEKTFAIKGDICWSKSKTEFNSVSNGYLVCIDGVSEGVFEKLPEQYAGMRVIDHSGYLVIPGMTDLHIHAPQYAFRGLGMNLELLDWLNTRTFPEESKYKDSAYADKAYEIFSGDLQHSPTTRAVVFGTMHVGATEILMDKLEESGLKTCVGKVNMDRNSPSYLCEKSAVESLNDTERWLDDCDARHYINTRPILTPRFTPTCSDELMKGLGRLKKERGLPLQSHLSENLSEINWVHELCPWSSCYGQTYERFGHLSAGSKCIMAHCNYSTDAEVSILHKHGVFVAHCPQSNAQLSSGIAPIRHYLDMGMNVGIGTDVAGGATLSMFRAIADTVAVSKLRWRFVDQSLAPLSTEEAFWLATVGGGSFFGLVGSFERGYELDALVLDDSHIRTSLDLSVENRVARYVYLAEEGGRIIRKYVAGKRTL